MVGRPNLQRAGKKERQRDPGDLVPGCLHRRCCHCSPHLLELAQDGTREAETVLPPRGRAVSLDCPGSDSTSELTCTHPSVRVCVCMHVCEVVIHIPFLHGTMCCDNNFKLYFVYSGTLMLNYQKFCVVYKPSQKQT